MSTSTGRTVVTGLEQDLPPAAQLTKQHEGHEHGSVARSDLIRICLVGIAVVFCWLRVWEPFPKLDIIGLAAVLDWGVSDLPRGSDRYFLASDDYGAIDDHRTRRCTGHPRGLHCACHRIFCAD